jgi:NAD(P)-dependent dehydrogenase (short-subunit alcohol dehydrogenase family)
MNPTQQEADKSGYRRMIEVSAAGRAGTPDEVGTVGALLMGPEGAFITGSEFLRGRWRDGGLLVR